MFNPHLTRIEHFQRARIYRQVARALRALLAPGLAQTYEVSADQHMRQAIRMVD